MTSSWSWTWVTSGWAKLVRDGGGDHLGRALGHPGQDVAEEVDPAALDGRTGHGGLDGLAQAQVGVGDDQLHPAKPTGLQAAQECRPEGPVLAVTHREAEDYIYIGERLTGQRSILKRRHLSVQVGADA
jgi:hypothetical protein